MEQINDGSFTAEVLTGAQYLRKVNDLLSARYGTTYSADELWRDIHGCAPGSEMAKLKQAYNEKVPPERFVREVADLAGMDLPKGFDRSPETVRTYARYKATLIHYADEARKPLEEGEPRIHGEWQVGVNGDIYLQGPDGVAKMEPLLREDGKWGYQISESPGGQVDQLGIGALLDVVADFEQVAIGPDIGETWDNFIKARPEYSPGYQQEQDSYRPRF